MGPNYDAAGSYLLEGHSGDFCISVKADPVDIWYMQLED
jgi:hypothetical protein